MGCLKRKVNTRGWSEGNATNYLFGGNRATSKSGGPTTRRGHDEGFCELQLSPVRLSIWGDCTGNAMQCKVVVGIKVVRSSFVYFDVDLAGKLKPKLTRSPLARGYTRLTGSFAELHFNFIDSELGNIEQMCNKSSQRRFARNSSSRMISMYQKFLEHCCKLAKQGGRLSQPRILA
jgi:hypothetical protein